MKGLPPFDEKDPYIWNNYKITKRPLALSPIEKPDMSPFLVHMTSKESLINILKHEHFDGMGSIKAQVPDSSKSDWYDKKVVCFTETVLHAIDSFRYISLSRHQSNLFYGLGFSKEKLAFKRDVKPALYMDPRLIGKVSKYYIEINKAEGESENIELKLLFDDFVPYITPAFQTINKQGFTWEREWRYSKSDSFDFDYSEIKIICCPEEDIEEIQNIIGENANQIKFVSTWSEYNEVKDFMESRKENFSIGNYTQENLSVLQTKRSKILRVKNQLNSYKDYALKLAEQITSLEEYIENFESEISKLDNQIEVLSQDIKISKFTVKLISFLKRNFEELLLDQASEVDISEDQVWDLLESLEEVEYKFDCLTEAERKVYILVINPLVDKVECAGPLGDYNTCLGDGFIHKDELLRCYSDIDQEMICSICQSDRDRYFED